MVDTGTKVLQKADRGDGALGVLLSDRETAENLRALIANPLVGSYGTAAPLLDELLKVNEQYLPQFAR